MMGLVLFRNLAATVYYQIEQPRPVFVTELISRLELMKKLK